MKLISYFPTAREQDLKELVLVEDTPHGELWKRIITVKRLHKLVFGLRMRVCIDALEKNNTPERLKVKL